MPAVAIFDLDNTLAESKAPLTPRMAELLARLLEETRVAVVSGGALPQFLKQVVGQLPPAARLQNLYLLPTSGAALYEHHNGGWDKVYEERIPEQDARAIERAMEEGARACGVVDFSEASWGPRVECRGAQVSFSALGQEAPVAEKKAWDPDKKKRHALREAIAARLPKGYGAAMGGSTTIDVTKDGIDKAYGIRQLARRLGVREDDVLYVGDELIAGGNDEAAFKTQARTHAVSGPADTERLILSLLSQAGG